jgi:hypothetical protein
VFNVETQKTNLVVVFAVALTGIIVIALAAGLLTAYQRVDNHASVKAVGVGVYSDAACTNNLTSIDWGVLVAGESYSRDVWVKSIGTTGIMVNMTTDSWSPSFASDYIILGWDREGQFLDVGESFKAVLTLSVSTTIAESDITDFSFDIVITGTEYS